MWNRAPVAAVASLLALTACSSGPEPEAEAAADCETVEQATLDSISSGAQEGTGLALVRGSAYRSPNHGEVYLVAAEFTADGIDGEVGVWATNSLDPASPGMIMSVDRMAQGFTVWPDAIGTATAISPEDPIVQTALDCL